MLQTFVWQHCQWHCLQKNFCLKLPNSVRNAKKLLEAMSLAMLPTKSLQHCQDQMIRANVSTMLWPCIISAIPFNWKLPWSQATCRKINFYQKRDVIPDCYCPFQLKVGFIQNLVRSADGYALGVVCNTKIILWKFRCDIPTCHQQ